MLSSIFTLTPTFTQGLIVGQISILTLLIVILKYLFLEPASRSEDTVENEKRPFKLPVLTPPSVKIRTALSGGSLPAEPKTASASQDKQAESAEWFNAIVQQVTQAYRLELRDHMEGAEGDEAARVRVERWANERTSSILDPIQVHQVDLGSAAPKLSAAQIRQSDSPLESPRIECRLTYSDSVSISLSTSMLLHYPTTSFAKLPVSLSISLSLFSAVVTLTPPSPSHPLPCLTLTLNPDFTLDLATTSLIGSRAKLSDVPKIHELIESKIRSILAERATWKVVLPGVKAKDVVDMLEKKSL